MHPSLFCLVNGKTKDKDGKTIEFKKPIPVTRGIFTRERDPFESRNYQWLPAEFLVNSSGKVKIASYINSLPLETGLYSVIAEIFERLVPIFNLVLTDLRTNRERVRFPKPDRYDYYWWEEVDCPDGIYDKDDYEETKDRKYMEWSRSRKIVPLPIPSFEAAKADNLVDLKGHRLQVIVKIGSIELTPEKPDFPSGNWHVEVRVYSFAHVRRTLMKV